METCQGQRCPGIENKENQKNKYAARIKKDRDSNNMEVIVLHILFNDYFHISIFSFSISL